MVPAAALEALAPITPGKLLGLEVHAAALEAQDDLRAIGNASVAFGGGSEARDYVRALHERRQAPEGFAERLREGWAERQREADRQRQRAQLARAAGLLATAGG